MVLNNRHLRSNFFDCDNLVLILERFLDSLVLEQSHRLRGIPSQQIEIPDWVLFELYLIVGLHPGIYVLHHLVQPELPHQLLPSRASETQGHDVIVTRLL